MAKEAYYFSHDSNARTDPKILQMRSVYGSEGYGWYWILIEMMREQENYELSIQGKYVFNAFASQMDTNADRVQCYIEDCVSEFKLFESDGNAFWSNSLKERMKLKEEKSEKARKSAEARWNKAKKTEENEQSIQTHSEDDANASKSDAIKESKVKENKIKNIFLSDSNEYRLADYLRKYILKNNPKAKVPEDDKLQSWCKVFDLMIRVDEREVEEIKSCIKFSQTDTFWMTNILSAASLRKQYDQLTMKMKSKSHNHEEHKKVDIKKTAKIINEPDPEYVDYQ